MSGDMHPADEERLFRAQEEALLARVKEAEARVELLAGLVRFTEARWPFLEAEERKQDPCAPAETIAGRARARLEAELRERGLDDAMPGSREPRTPPDPTP